MSDERYNGWANRETWAANLHLSNDQGLYEDLLDTFRGFLEGDTFDGGPGSDVACAGEIVEEFVLDIFELAEEVGWSDDLRGMRDDIGSLWRVDWREIGAAWLGNARDERALEEG